VGYGYAATLAVATRTGIQNSGLTVSFAPPTIPTLTGVTSMATSGSEAVTITGTSFGPLGTAVTAQYFSTVYAANRYSATGCSVQTAHSVIVCSSVAGVGASLYWTVTVGGQSGTSSGTTSYVAPALSGASIAPASAATAGGTVVTIAGTNLGPASQLIAPVVTYYASAYSATVYTATSCTGAHSSMTCTLAMGVGSSLVFTVSVGAQTTAPFASSLRYTTAAVTNVLGGLFGTSGGATVTIVVRRSLMVQQRGCG
jgi:hypothetical protein